MHLDNLGTLESGKLGRPGRPERQPPRRHHQHAADRFRVDCRPALGGELAGARRPHIASGIRQWMGDSRGRGTRAGLRSRRHGLLDIVEDRPYTGRRRRLRERSNRMARRVPTTAADRLASACKKTGSSWSSMPALRLGSLPAIILRTLPATAAGLLPRAPGRGGPSRSPLDASWFTRGRRNHVRSSRRTYPGSCVRSRRVSVVSAARSHRGRRAGLCDWWHGHR